MPCFTRITDQMEKSELDNRLYRVIELLNGLQALLVHDPDTDKASASASVNVGNFSDEENMPGMAHAVEHLLFMGTEKYPKENDYIQYLAAHSGSRNAYTSATETNYFFEVAATGESSDDASTSSESDTANGLTSTSSSSPSSLVPPLYGALKRFAQFFIAPLFLQSTLDRELRAVDSENKKNQQNDEWRLMQLNKSLSNPKHPYHRFATGNLQTLHDDPQARGVEIRNKFINFYKEHYSANRTKLVVLGRESLDQLQEWVVELFSEVENKDLPQNRWDDVQPFSAEQLCTQVFAKSVMDLRSFDIDFPFLDEEDLYETHPSRYISHLIGHEGPGSILAYIKAKGWANGLSACAIHICPGASFFRISVLLTEDGLSHYRDVAKTIFQYIAMIKEHAPEQWIFDEMKSQADRAFRFKEKSPVSQFTSWLSNVMQEPLPREWLLSGNILLRKFDPELITKALSYLRADNFRLMIVSQHFPGDWNAKEEWYGTEYKEEKIPEDFLREIQDALASSPSNRIQDLHMPHRNEFIPTRLSVEKKETPQPAKAPKLLRLDDDVRVWHKKDDRFWVPKATVHIILRNSLVWATPANYVKANIYCELVTDALGEYCYDARLAGLGYSLSASSFGLELSVSGYNDKMSVLLEKVAATMRDLVIKADRFKIIKERLTREYRNAEYQQPFHQVIGMTCYLTAEKMWINEQYAAELEHIKADDVAAFFPQLFRQNHIEVLAHGNLDKEDALTMTDIVEDIVHSRPLPQSQWHVQRDIIFPPGSNYIYERQLKDPQNVNNCIEYYLFIGSIIDDSLRAKLLLFAQMTEEPAFNQLRSKEQLGYVVWSGDRSSATTIGYRVIIQSERTTEYLEDRIDAFLGGFAQTLEDMTKEEFEGHKRSIINKRLEKLKNLRSETARFWTHIESEYFNFEQHEIDAATVGNLTKEDVIAFFQQYINPTSETRAKVSIHLNAQSADTNELLVDASETAEGADALHIQKPNGLSVKPRGKPTYITNVPQFKAGLPVSAGPSPLVDLDEFKDF